MSFFRKNKERVKPEESVQPKEELVGTGVFEYSFDWEMVYRSGSKYFASNTETGTLGSVSQPLDYEEARTKLDEIESELAIRNSDDEFLFVVLADSLEEIKE